MNGKLLAASLDNLINIWILSGKLIFYELSSHCDCVCAYHVLLYCTGSRTQLKERPSHVTSLCFPADKGFMDGHLGLSMEVMLVGHRDGSVCSIEILDSTTFNIQQIEHASRSNGKTIRYCRYNYMTSLELCSLTPIVSSICM